jgi:predicted PurR-regulated permease PerM
MADQEHPTTDEPAPKVGPEAVAAAHDPVSDRLRPAHLYRAVGLAFLLAMTFRYWEELLRVLLLVYAAVMLAVVLNALRAKLHMGRAWLAGIVALLVIGTLAGVVVVGGPLLVREVRGLAETLPELQEQAQGWREAAEEALGMEVPLPDAERLREAVTGEGVLVGWMGRAAGALGALAFPFIVFIGALFGLAKPNERLLTPALRLFPENLRLAWYRIFQLLAHRLVGWAKGTALAMLAVGTLTTAALMAIGVPNALGLGLLNGLLEFVPIFGPLVGGLIAVLIALLDDPQKALITLAAMVVIQQLESQVITPWAMSQGAELHPFVTLFAVVLFGGMFGFLGVFLAVPLALLVWTLVQVLWVERSIDTDREVIAPVVKD